MSVDRVIDQLKGEFAQGSYNLLSKNCKHFANAFLSKLIGEKHLYQIILKMTFLVI